MLLIGVTLGAILARTADLLGLASTALLGLAAALLGVAALGTTATGSVLSTWHKT